MFVSYACTRREENNGKIIEDENENRKVWGKNKSANKTAKKNNKWEWNRRSNKKVREEKSKGKEGKYIIGNKIKGD